MSTNHRYLNFLNLNYEYRGLGTWRSWEAQYYLPTSDFGLIKNLIMPNGAKNWCFTLNNPTNVESTHIAGLIASTEGLVSYLVVGRETGENGTPHLQGFVQFSRRCALARCRRLISNRAHFEIARGTPLEASNYCKKDGDFNEYGQLGVSQGKRSDWDKLKEFVLEKGSVPTNRELAGNFPGLYARSNKLNEICKSFLPPPVLVTGDPRPGFQSTIWNMVQNECTDTRKVYFFVDFVGNKGKTWICAKLFSHFSERVQVLSVGKRDDLAHAIDESKDIFLFDCPRGTMEFLQYSVLEKLKDRMIFSPKYCSAAKILTKLPHVIVFSNEEPDNRKMSQDRYDITICG